MSAFLVLEGKPQLTSINAELQTSIICETEFTQLCSFNNLTHSCFSDVSGLSNTFPAVDMVFGNGQKLSLSPENYLFRVSIRLLSNITTFPLCLNFLIFCVLPILKTLFLKASVSYTMVKFEQNSGTRFHSFECNLAIFFRTIGYLLI